MISLNIVFTQSVNQFILCKQHKLNNNETIQITVTGYQNSKCSSKLVAQIRKKNRK